MLTFIKFSRNIELIKKIFSFYKGYKVRLLIIYALSFGSMIFSLIPLYLLKPLTDEVFLPSSTLGINEKLWRLHFYMFIMILLYVMEGTIGAICQYKKDWLNEKVGNNLRSAIFAHLQKLSIRFYNYQTSGDIMMRVEGDTAMLQGFFIGEALALVINTLMVIIMGIVLFKMDWRLTMCLLIPIPIVIFLSQLVGEKMRIIYLNIQRKSSNLSSILISNLFGVMLVKTTGTERSELHKFVRALRKVFFERLRISKYQLFLVPWSGAVIYLSGMAVRWYGGYKVVSGHLTLGELTVFMALIWQLYGPVQFLSDMPMRIQGYLSSAERFFKVLDTEPEIVESPNCIVLEPFCGEVAFRQVYFSYDGKTNVLENINFIANPGEVIGITGPSGSGKTTLVHLLCRLYQPQSGNIYIDGHNIKELKMSFLRKSIGIVLQNTHIFYGTVAENIAYGEPEASKREIIAAAKATGAHDFIMRLPNAYDTMLGEAGIGLSGGERQRIAVARAILKNPKIIVFDEATSSVDLGTAVIIQNTIEKLAGTHTVFVITHHSSMLTKTDKVAVIENGKLLRVGTYSDVVESGWLKEVELRRWRRYTYVA